VADEIAGRHFRCRNCGATVSASSEGTKPGRGPSTDTLLPAIGMYVTAGLSIPVILGVLIVGLMRPPERMPPPGPERDSFVVGYRLGQFTFAGLVIVSNCAELFGAYHLHTHRSRKAALTGAILCCVPCLSPCLVMGIPFGIWALVVLNLSDVKERFA
jgi:hypothetical protein